MARRTDSRWLVRASAIALSFGCLAIGAMDRGSAQSFQGTSNVVAGVVDSITTGSGTTNILINGASPQAVIDWTPTDQSASAAIISFQDAGSTATFSRSGGLDFAVLNRILPAGAAVGRAVQLDGNIRGEVGISVPTPGGRVYFYTPNGLIIGSNAQIDVGALGLTTSSPQIIPGAFTGGFITGTGSDTVTLNGANAGSYVAIQPNAQINALVNGSSYVAVFAPTILQGGTINVDGSAALIAAEAGTMTWSGGLFNVAVTTGTDGDANNQAIFHTGATVGPASSGAGDNHRIYTVAVPKNTAITTLIASGSTLGFDVAGAANAVGNSIILTGGYDLTPAPGLSAGAGTGISSVQVTNTTVTSDLSIYATSFGAVEAVGGGSSALSAGLFIRSPVAARVEGSSAASALNITGDVFLDVSRTVGSGSITSGNGLLMATGGGTLSIGGSASVSSEASTGSGGTASGGLVRVLVDGGSSFSVGGDLSLASIGSIGEADTGNGVGGTSEMLVIGSGSIASITGDLDIEAVGFGGGVFADLFSGVAGGNGTGGNARILTSGATSLTVDGTVNVEANGRGGEGNLAASGSAQGGTAQITAELGSTMTLRSGVTVEASATSGSVSFGFSSVVANSTDGGDANAGSASLAITGTGTTVNIGGNLSMFATGITDGTALVAPGGFGSGNIANIGVQDGSLSISGATLVDATGRGGSGATENGGTGGTINVVTTGTGTLTLHQTNLLAEGIGGAELGASVTGNGGGGFAGMRASNASSITVNGSLQLNANGRGGFADSNPGLLNPGSGGGGDAEVSASNTSSITVTGTASVNAIGFGADAEVLSAVDVATGGAGNGGLAHVIQEQAATLQFDQDLDIRAYGQGGIGSGAFAGIANGGAGIGGTAELRAGTTGSTGSITIGGTTAVDAAGLGGGSISNGSGGQATGGVAMVRTVGGSASTIQAGGADTGFSVSAEASGGFASGTGTGGNATGGTAQIEGAGGSITITSGIAINGSADGGSSVNGNGGTGYAGIAQITASLGSVVTLTADVPTVPIVVDATGTGGSATGTANGAEGSGGQASVTTFDAGVVNVNGNLVVSAVSDGGDGRVAGNARGNDNPFLDNVAFAGVVATSGSITVSGTTNLLANALAGDANSPGGTGGTAVGGFASIFSNGSTGAASISLGAVSAFASAQGGEGQLGNAGLAGGDGGAATAGVASILGTADDGDLVTGNLFIDVSAIGGAGFPGGDDPDGPGGNGGAGGNAISGAGIIGINDGSTAGVGGTAVFDDVTVFGFALGGAGGGGGTSLTVDGDGGAGGSAVAAAIGTSPTGFFHDGPTQIVATGGSVSMGNFALDGRAFGGEGGPGNTPGIGGDATSGGFDILVKPGGPSGQAAGITALDVSVGLSSVPGTSGASYYGSGPRVSIESGTVIVGDLAIAQSGNAPAPSPAVGSAELSVVNGLLNANALSFVTDGNLSVFLDNVSINSIVATSVILGANNFVTNSAGLVPVSPGLIGADFVSVSSFGDIIIDGSIESVSDLSLTAPGLIRTYDLASGGAVSVGAGGSVITRDIFAGTDAFAESATGAVSFQDIFSVEDVDILAAQAVQGVSIIAGDSVTIESGDSITMTAQIDAGVINPSGATGAVYSAGLRAVNNIVTNGVSAANEIGIGSLTGSVSGSTLSAGSNILVLARTGATFGSVDSVGGPGTYVYFADSSMFALAPPNPFDPSPIFAAQPVAMSGPITIGSLVGGRIVMASGLNVTLGEVFADESVFVRGSSLLLGTVDAVGPIRLDAGSLISALGITSETGNVDLLGGSVIFNHVTAGGSVAVQAAQDIGIFTEDTDGGPIPGAITAGRTVRLVALNGSILDVSAPLRAGVPRPPEASITANGNILALAGDSLALRSLTSANGGIYIANSSMAQSLGSVDNFNINSRIPTAMGGTVLLSGNVAGAGMRAASIGAMSLQGVATTQLVDLRTDGLLSLGGNVSGLNVLTTSSDIAIGATGGINAPSGVVIVRSTNTNGMIIGDTGLTGGYQISAAEFARVSGGSVNISATDIAGQAIDMVIGDLNVTGPLAGSTVESSTGALRFGTGQNSQNPSGGIRITGKLAGRGFTPTNQLAFFTGTLQLDAATGLIEMLGQGTQLSGEIVFNVQRFHGAELSILDRLLENPTYAGRANDINTPLAIARPDGVVRAADINTDAVSQLLMQNTGTSELRAGFLVVGSGPIERDVAPPLGSIEFIVNGQIITDTGTLTGPDVFNTLITADNRPFFTPESSINGCLISGTVCQIEEPQPDVTEMDAEFLPSDSITHFTQEPAREEQAVDPEEREEAEEEAKRAPIPPPTPIISTQPLAPVIDVDEPVAGAGNPGFISSAPVPAGQGRETAQ